MSDDEDQAAPRKAMKLPKKAARVKNKVCFSNYLFHF